MKKWFRKLRFATAIILLTIASLLFLYLGFLSYYQGKFYPGVKISGRDMGGQDALTIADSLNGQFQDRANHPLNLAYLDQTFMLNLSSSAPTINLGDTLRDAYQKGRSGNIPIDIKDQFMLLMIGQDFNPQIKYKDFSQITSQINSINQKVGKDAISAQIVFAENISVVPAQDGIEIDSKQLLTSIENYLALKRDRPTILPLKPKLAAFSTLQAEKDKKALEAVKSSPLTLQFESGTWVIDQPTLYSLLDFDQAKTELDPDKLQNYLTIISDKINQPLEEAKFVFDESTQRVTQFQPGQPGRQLNIAKAASLISQAVGSGNMSNIQLPVETTSPKNSTGEINHFGIKELLGIGTSSFIDSIPNRVYNIGLSSHLTNGILVAPGDTFSFNKYLGEVNAATGFKQAYVIKEGKTVLDDGGGVCQVSTTLFRAVLNAGLPIIERTAHAYRVGFYEQGGTSPGFDATVYPPFVDFKFKNDTASYILIQNQMVGTTLSFKIYGTSDGRTTTIGKPVVLSQTPPPPDLRQDDPTLPKGVEKETEHAIWGMNTQFKRTVVRNGETIIDEVWRSNFRPWQKVILVGTKT